MAQLASALRLGRRGRRFESSHPDHRKIDEDEKQDVNDAGNPLTLTNQFMNIIEILQSKPVLIGLHLGFAIVGIDAFLWLLGKLKDDGGSRRSWLVTAWVGVAAFVLSWLAGGYYYVVYYGTLVKPVIKSGVAPWAHEIIMETKEHIFLFVIPLAMTVLFITMLEKEDTERLKLRHLTMWLTGAVVILGFLIGAMGFVISAAARWGVVN